MITTVPHQRPTQLRILDPEGDELLIDVEGEDLVITTLSDGRYVPVLLTPADVAALRAHIEPGRFA